MADVQIAVIDQQNTEVTVAVPGIQGIQGQTGDVAVAQDGTAALPGIRFENDTNTGIYRPGADQLALSTSGTGRLFVDASGRVGIGSSTVGTAYIATLTGNGSTIVGGLQLNTNANITYFGAVGATSADIELWNVANGFARFATNNTERLRITAEGKVGVGTSTPLKELQINATTPTIRLEENGTGAKRLELSVNAAAEARIFAGQSASQLLLGTADLERLRITADGRVLVGTSSARSNFYNTTFSSKFQVEGANDGNSRSTSCVYGQSNASGPIFILGKHRSDSVGGTTVVNDGDELGTFTFQGSDGAQFVAGAQIAAYVDGTPGANDMPGRLVFTTTPSGGGTPVERCRIDSTGWSNFFGTVDVIGARSADGPGTTNAVFAGRHSATSTVDGTVSFLVYTNGNTVNTNNSYGAISDIKLKENIVDANSQWSDIKSLQVRNYNFKEGQTHTQIGLIAQEVELVSPGLVSESPDRDEDGNDLGTVTKSVNYSVLYMKAVKALQEAMERIETLEAKVAALESA